MKVQPEGVRRVLGPGRLAVLGVLVFWAGVLAAGSLVDGYSAREDYISSLASRGSPVAVLGIGALLASAGAHLATSWAVVTSWRSWLLASFLLMAALATGGVAAFRASCHSGPTGCGVSGTSGQDWVDAVHGMSVGAYQLFVLAAMLTMTLGALRRTPRWPQWLGAVSFVFAVGSAILFAQINGDELGLWQRLWVANNLAWLLVVAWTSPPRSRPGQSGRGGQ